MPRTVRRARPTIVAPVEKPRERTLEVRVDYVFESLLKNAQEDIERCKAACAAWAVKFNSNPAYELAWSQGVFADAARLATATTVRDILTIANDDPYEGDNRLRRVRHLRDWLRDGVMSKARSPERSTSPQSNEVSLHTMSQQAEWLQKIERRALFSKVDLTNPEGDE